MEFKNEITNMSLDDYIAMSKLNNVCDGAAHKLNRCNNEITNMSLDDYIAMSKLNNVCDVAANTLNRCNNEITNMSLDDYIGMSNKLNNVCDGAANKLNRCNDFKFGRRKESNEAEAEEEDDEEQVNKIEGQDIKNDVDMEIWKGPDASVAYIDCHDQRNDRRNKLNVAKVTPSSTYRYRYLENVSKVIQRNPNNTFDCPRGTSTTLPFNTQQQRHGGFQRGNYRNRNRRYNNYFNRGSHHNNSSGNYMNMNPNNNNYQNNIGIGGLRSQRNNNQNLRMNTGNGYNSNHLREAQSPGTSKNLVIEFPSNAIKFGQSFQFKSRFRVPNADKEKIKAMPVGNLTAQAEAALNLESPNTASNSCNENLKSLLGFQGNVSGDMMPLFAYRLMRFLQNGTQPQVHKPVYDMKMQQEIHEIQNKPMLYKCNGGEVMSSDGAGINCKIIPRSSGISLNCRFA